MNYLYLILIIILLFVICNHFNVFLMNRKINTSYQGENKSPESIGFVKPEHRLLQIFNNISGGNKIKLAGNCNRFIYNKNTITPELNEKLVIIVKDIISSLNHIANNDFFVKTIENVYSIVDSKKNQRYLIDFFIYDTKNYYTIRLITDVVIIDGEIYINYLNLQSASNSILINKYDIKFNSSGILFDSDMFQEDIIKLFDNHYSKEFVVIGVSDSSLEYNKEDLTGVLTLSSFKNSYLPPTISSDTYEDLNKKDLSGYLDIYLPENQNLIKNPAFCNKYKINWDSYGIKDNQDISDNCYMHTNQTTTEINEPWNGPGVIYERSSRDKYKWLKDPAIGNIIRSQGYHL